MASIFTLGWVVAFPFLYGLLISRLFGIKKPIDHWILVCLQISSSVLAFICEAYVFSLIKTSDLLPSRYAGPLSAVIGLFVPMFVYHGLIWQFVLKDRKLNGFLISLICTSAYCFPFLFTTDLFRI